MPTKRTKRDKAKGAARKAAPKPAKPTKQPTKPAKPKKTPLVLQSEKVTLPGGQVRRADKYRYPKGHPKAGQYAPKSEAKAAGSIRYVRRLGGKREAIEAHGSGDAVKVSTVNIGRSFHEQAKAYHIKDAAIKANAEGKKIVIRLGGEVYMIPQERQGDAIAWLTDLSAKFLSIAGKNGRGNGYPFSAELHYGEGGIFIDLDRIDFFSAELRSELGRFSDYREQAEELAEYMARTARSFMGVKTTGAKVLGGWDEAGTINTDEDQDQ